MAYLHCHNCNWEQDDFWNWTIKWNKLHKWNSRPFGYNPLSLILEDFACYWKPRRIKFDKYTAIEMGFKTNNIHSWSMLRHGLKIHFNRLFTQKWRTWEAWKKDKDSGVAECPGCRSKKDFDID